jgi:hypothetical protein
MITVAIRTTLSDAFLLKSYLEGSGVAAFVPDELSAQNNMIALTTTGGIRVQVAPEDEARARELVAAFDADQA